MQLFLAILHFIHFFISLVSLFVKLIMLYCDLLLLYITNDRPRWWLYFNFLKTAWTTTALTPEGSGEVNNFSLHVVEDSHFKWTTGTAALSSTTISVCKITAMFRYCTMFRYRFCSFSLKVTILTHWTGCNE